jgi:hypothetical protein
MPTYVLYAGRLIEKRYRPARSQHAASELPAPAVQSFETYLSPIDNTTISSSRQRERDLHNSGSYDPRDTPAAYQRAQNVRQQQQRHRVVTTEP